MAYTRTRSSVPSTSLSNSSKDFPKVSTSSPTVSTNLPMVSTSSQTNATDYSSTILTVLREFCIEAKDFYIPSSIAELQESPSPMEFLRRYVMPNIPVVVRGGVQGWPALTKWTDEYLLNCLGEKQITVAMTPNGYADAPVGERFVQPDEQQMTFERFLRILHQQQNGGDDGRRDDVAYIQKQNSSFTEEFSELLSDISDDISWATAAFACKPDALNFWMGGERSVTSMHKDPYENMYAVVRGAKTFILHPPTDLHCIPYELYTAARYKKIEYDNMYYVMDEINEQCCELCETDTACKKISKEKFAHKYKSRASSNLVDQTNEWKNLCLCHSPSRVPWVAIDPLKPNLKKYPQYKNSTPLTITIYPGDLLYLPSLWFHHVRQQNGTIAVNFWYDMQYDLKYVYYKMLERITQPILKEM